MANKYANLCSTIKFKKCDNYYSNEVRIIIIKIIGGELRNGNKKFKPKIMNNFLVGKSVSSSIYKP